jgi:hypothetical protein
MKRATMVSMAAATIAALVDWRIDSWLGNNCFNLSGIPNARIRDGARNFRKSARDQNIARPTSASWRLTWATSRGCPAG